jgi:hypothetical protein
MSKAIKNANGVPIWARSGCKCSTCVALRKLERKRKEKKK